jgi:hypothetical protein
MWQENLISIEMFMLPQVHKRHNIQHNDTQFNNIEHNDTQPYDSQHDDTQLNNI